MRPLRGISPVTLGSMEKSYCNKCKEDVTDSKYINLYGSWRGLEWKEINQPYYERIDIDLCEECAKSRIEPMIEILDIGRPRLEKPEKKCLSEHWLFWVHYILMWVALIWLA
jgi:hypothetical protein